MIKKTSKLLKSFIKSKDQKEILLPRLKEFLAREEEAMLAGKISKKAGTIRDAQLTIMCFKNRIKEFNHGEDPKGDYFHPSALGACQRQIFLDIFGAPRDSNKIDGDDILRRYLVFETGTYIHVMIQNLCSRAGFMVKREVGILDAIRKIIGHADAILRIDGKKYLLEIKSINSNGYFKLDGPKHEHKAQTHAYMEALGLDGVIFLYYDKDKNTLKEYVLDFDPTFHQKFVVARIKTFFAKVKARIAPEREGTHPKAFPCTYCSFKKVCWESGRIEAFLKRIKNEKTKHKHE